jgi:hypothetical protein
LVDEQDEHPEPPDMLEPNEPPVPRDEYFPRPKADGIFAVFLDLHLGQEAVTFSFIPKVTISNSFLHLAHLYSYIGIASFLHFSPNLNTPEGNVKIDQANGSRLTDFQNHANI